mmetsp:Transcript_8100/g.12388  ORF Transcript_8100/g.12388 Transcript_8100/m.12388 type:complete len:191 (-) Transcript_8100:1344-1916(-)
MPSSRNKIENTMDWLAKRVGFVDMVCCNSYSEEQIYSENSTSDYQLNPVNLPASWDLDDSSVEEQETLSEIYDVTQSNDNVGPAPPATQFKNMQSPTRSMGTASTVTTSTTTTIITRARVDPNGNQTVPAENATNFSENGFARKLLRDSIENSNLGRSKPQEIYCDRSGEKIISQSSRHPFTSVAEGYKL